MTRWWRPRSVRVRLALWHVGALVVVLAAYAIGVFVFVQRNLTANLDRQLLEDFDRAEESFQRNPDGTLSRHAADRDADEPDPEPEPGPWVCVWSPAGAPLHRDPATPATVAAAPGPVGAEEERYESVHSPRGTWIRQLTGSQDIGGLPAVVRVARPEEPLRRELSGLLLVLALGLPAAAVLAGLAGYAVARRALSPVERMAAAARRITATRLDARLPVENPADELGQLASVFNETVGRLEASFEQLRRFTADASHEMRTPLTAIRTVGEVGLREPRSAPEYREIVGSMLEEVDRLNGLVESLLTLARADGGHMAINRGPVDLAALTREVGEHLGVLAEDRQQAMVIEADTPVPARADRVLLRQALINLLDNAIKYSPERGHLRLLAGTRGPDAVIEVHDSGPGIPADQVDRIFDRFYRVDRARSRELGGGGLGLSIARRAVEANGGRIEVTPGDGGGSIFRIVLSGGA